MSYATPAEVIESRGRNDIGVLAGLDGNGDPDSAVIQKALDDASDEIDTYIAAKYQLPLATTPKVLTRIAIDIAVYRMAPEADKLTEERRRRYTDAVKFLDKVAKGTVSLGLASPGAPSRAYARTRPRRFSRETMSGLAGGAPREFE